MKRAFFIDGKLKEAPAYLKETPQVGSFINYNETLYKVIKVAYNLECRGIYIYITVKL